MITGGGITLLVVDQLEKLTDHLDDSDMVNVLKFCTPTCLIKWLIQTVQTQIRRLLKEQSDQGLHCLHFHQVFCGINA